MKFIVDSMPAKVGLFAPGTDVRVVSEEDLHDVSVDSVFVVGARNFHALIISKIKSKFPAATIFCSTLLTIYWSLLCVLGLRSLLQPMG